MSKEDKIKILNIFEELCDKGDVQYALSTLGIMLGIPAPFVKDVIRSLYLSSS